MGFNIVCRRNRRRKHASIIIVVCCLDAIVFRNDVNYLKNIIDSCILGNCSWLLIELIMWLGVIRSKVSGSGVNYLAGVAVSGTVLYSGRARGTASSPPTDVGDGVSAPAGSGLELPHICILIRGTLRPLPPKPSPTHPPPTLFELRRKGLLNIITEWWIVTRLTPGRNLVKIGAHYILLIFCDYVIYVICLDYRPKRKTIDTEGVYMQGRYIINM